MQINTAETRMWGNKARNKLKRPAPLAEGSKLWMIHICTMPMAPGSTEDVEIKDAVATVREMK